MKNGARIVSLAFLIVVLRIPDSDNSLSRVAIVLKFFNGKLILAISSSAVRAVKHTVVFGVVLELRSYGNNGLRRTYATKKLARLYGANSRHGTTPNSKREGSKDVVDMNNSVFDLKGVKPTGSCWSAIT
jgi:hypothetical protein